MLLFLQFDVLTRSVRIARNRAHPAEFLELSEISFLGLEHTERTDPRVAGFTVAGEDSSFTAWHSRNTLLGRDEQCKTNKHDRKTGDFELYRLLRQKLFWQFFWPHEAKKPCHAHDDKRLNVADDSHE